MNVYWERKTLKNVENKTWNDKHRKTNHITSYSRDTSGYQTMNLGSQLSNCGVNPSSTKQGWMTNYRDPQIQWLTTKTNFSHEKGHELGIPMYTSEFDK